MEDLLSIQIRVSSVEVCQSILPICGHARTIESSLLKSFKTGQHHQERAGTVDTALHYNKMIQSRACFYGAQGSSGLF